VALGTQAIEHGSGVYLVRAHELLEDLRRAQAEHRLDRRLRVYLAPKVLIIDEFGVWPYDRLAATALFAPIAARYERGSIIRRRGDEDVSWQEPLCLEPPLEPRGRGAVLPLAVCTGLAHHRSSRWPRPASAL
jgi:hypothetical protein